eukprot:15468244-Alexandrium_andersonii.AAC.1
MQPLGRHVYGQREYVKLICVHNIYDEGEGDGATAGGRYVDGKGNGDNDKAYGAWQHDDTLDREGV